MHAAACVVACLNERRRIAKRASVDDVLSDSDDLRDDVVRINDCEVTHAVYVPVDVNFRIVLLPLVVTVGDPVLMPV